MTFSLHAVSRTSSDPLTFHPSKLPLAYEITVRTSVFSRAGEVTFLGPSFKKCSNIGDVLLKKAVLLVVRRGSTSLEPSEELLLLPKPSVLVYQPSELWKFDLAYSMVLYGIRYD